MLYKNGQNQLRTITLGKDTYEQEIIELRENKENRFIEEVTKRRQKTLKNVKTIKISSKDKGEVWVDKINSKDIEYGNKGWIEELMGLLPYKEDTNFFIDEEALSKLDIGAKGVSETNEKIYAFACFLPPGNFKSCFLFNQDSEQQKKKGIYSF